MTFLLSGLTNAYAKGAKLNGATVLEDCPVSKIDVNENNSVRGVTVGGNEKIYANKVVIAGGAWARDIAKTVNVEIPIMVNKHSYVVSEIIPGISAYPNLRMYDYALYFKVLQLLKSKQSFLKAKYCTLKNGQNCKNHFFK